MVKLRPAMNAVGFESRTGRLVAAAAAIADIAMLCAEKDRLVAEHRRAALVYSRAMIALNRKRATTPASEYERLRLAADGASIKCKEARLALKRHMADHGC